MEELELFQALTAQSQTQELLKTVSYTERFGLTLTKKDAELLAAERWNSLQTQKRVEFGEGILPKIIYEFCDSAYICQEDYVETLVRLQDIFYLYKNEMQDEITDDELLHFMKEQFEEVCYGDLEYLEGTCLDIFAQAVRAGYRGYTKSDGKKEYQQFDKVPRWNRKLYQEVLQELCWR